ncbi:MAG: SDR family oxidoreductase [Chitinophagaceae bacterium]
MKKNILITGGAGFIGSNLVDKLLKDERVGKVRVLDNLSTGFYSNIERFSENPAFEFIKGDIVSYEQCVSACKGMQLISHQAALGSVPRSIQDPITTNTVNIGGTLNVFTAAKNSGIERIIYAASSSTYGSSNESPKIENIIGSPLSPYAITKYVNELYANVFKSLYNVDFIGLRYFNVFGPYQNPGGEYAAVIPIFVNSILKNTAPVINGDGSVSRDFTYVENAVQANVLGLFTQDSISLNQVYNIACGQSTTLNDLFFTLKNISESQLIPQHGKNRIGDIQHSLADISKARKLLGYSPSVNVQEGLERTYLWYSKL